MQENEMNWKKHEQNQKNINYRKLYETHTHRQTESERSNDRNESKTEGKNNASKMIANKETWKGHESQLFAWEMERHVQSRKVW